MSAIEMWAGVASASDRHAEFVDRQTEAATARMLALAAIGPGDAVLDLASGPGGAGLAAAGLVGPSGRVVLSDGAPEMVQVAAHRAAGIPQVETVVVDLDAIDLPASSFDAILCRNGLMFVQNRVATVTAVAGRLRPGGTFVAASWDRREENPWIGLVLDALGEQFGVPFPPPQVPSPFSLDDQERVTGVFADAGLEDVRVETVPTPLRVASLDDWWERVPELAGPVATVLAGMEQDVREAIRARALAAAAAAARPVGDGVELAGSILVTCGVRPAAARLS